MNIIIDNLNKVIVGAIFVLLGLVLGFIYWLFPANTLIPLWTLCLVIIVCVFICIVEYALLVTSDTANKPYKLPEVKNLSIKDGVVIFITESVDLLSIQSVVSVYVQNIDDVEYLIGLGYIETKNEKGYLQIRLVKNNIPDFSFDEYKNNSKKLDTIKIKHSIPIEFLKGEI